MNHLQSKEEALRQAADAFGQLHARAQKALGEAQRSMSQLQWEGPAGRQMKQAYAAFRDKYHEPYLQMLRNYQQCLLEAAQAGGSLASASRADFALLADQRMGAGAQGKAGAAGKARCPAGARVRNRK